MTAPEIVSRPAQEPPDAPARAEAVRGSADELTDLAMRAGRGESRAAGELLAHVHPVVVRYCRARLGGLAGGYCTADDVAQDVCLAVLRALPTYQDRGRPFVAFVLRVAANKVVDAQRRAVRAEVPFARITDRPDERAGPEEHAVVHSEAARAHELLGPLPTLQREIILSRVVVGLSAGETGAILGMPAGRIRLIQHRTLQRLRRMAAESEAS